ncbi:MAG: NADH-quinone oxidoreductase subunit L [Proteobacteria bacterium]|nr:NADH-quinone oxidoreductase subunit L [Pseudomonadota bacterium]
MENLATLTILLPGLGALAAALTYLIPFQRALPFTKPSLPHHIAMLFTTGSVLAAAAGAWTIFLSLQPTTYNLQPFSLEWFTWLALPTWQVSFGALIDKLSATMLIVVTTVSACVHVYSVGYMHDDPSRRRFFIYLSAFTLAMLLLVTATNLVQMFLGWEGVGVCSYLLIGFWHHKATANAAAIKAFIVNRVADAAMLVGLFLLLHTFNSLTYADIFGQLAQAITNNESRITNHDLNLIALLIFVGAMGKSAQFGLHTWLPDAMEGPTPVSALIHAATMVTAGVFLLCRLSPLYEATPAVLHLVGWVGAITAIFAATVGLTQRDIKRVIAYSTCSQLGYMFFAIGVSAYPAAMFHLTTHAFFKGLLFLGAGSVIHGMHHEQDIFKMGALRKALPITYGLMWVGSLALAGIPPFAGFFSKDLILESAYMAPNGAGVPLYLLGTAAAFLTAVYGFRIIFMAFNGKFQDDSKHGHHTFEHAHESPLTMLIPMSVLGFGALASGYLLSAMGHLAWWQGAITINEHHTALEAAENIPWYAAYAPLLLGVAGIALAWHFFAVHRNKAKQAAETFTLAYAISLNKWYVDEFYNFLWVRPTAAIARLLSSVGDKLLIDGTVNGTAAAAWAAGQRLRTTQTGLVYHYGFTMLAALVLGLGYILWRSL